MSLSMSSPALSLYSIPAAWVCAFVPHVMKNGVIMRAGGYTNVHPRSMMKRLEEKNPAEFKRVSRMDAAHQNGNEILPLWIGAIVVGNFAGLGRETLNKFAATFIALRVLYNTIYISDTLNPVAGGLLRTGVWAGSIGTAMTLIVKSVNALAAVPSKNL